MEKPPKYRFFSMRRLLSKKKPARAGLAAAPPKASSSAKEFAWFVSHIQRQGGDQAHLLALLAPLLHDGLPGWFDMFVRGDLNADTMKAGVLASRNFVLYLTDGIPNSWFCLLELDTALANNANMVLVLETDEVRGAVADLDQTFGLIASRLNFNCGVSDSPADETTSGFNSFGKPPGFKRWTGAEIRARFSKVIEYDHKHPEESIRQIMHSPAPPLPQFQSSGADVQIVCNRVQGLDQAWVLMLMMAELGIKAAIVQHAREFDPSLPTIFFCTQHLLEDEVVVSALKQVDASSKVALVHEADGRRHGGLNGSEELFWSTMLSGDEGGLLRAKSASSVAFSKSTRNVMFSGAFSSAVLDLLGLLPPPFACRQPSLVLPEFETSVALPRVSDWVLNDQSERGMLLKRNGLLASLPRDRVVAFVDCSLEVDDFGVVKSLAAQLVAGIPGFAQGLHLDTDVQDLDELCDVLLVCPLETAQSLLFFAKQGKLVAVLRGLTSDALARALRLVMDKFPPTFGLVISSEVDNVHRALNDLSDGETEQKAVVAQPTTAAAATKLGETKARWDICIIFVPNEGSNAARSLAIELANNGNQKVWFDANRHELQPHQVALGILYSNLIVVVVTKSLATHPMLLTELRLARTCDKRIVFVKEGDPVYFGDKDLVVEGDHVLELKRMGKPRKELVNMLREEAGFPVLLDAYQPAFDCAASLVFTGSEAEALDSYYNLAAALQPLGISSCFTEDANQDLSQSKALVVYLTEHCLQQPHVLSLFKSAKVRFPIHDVDFRRAHSAVNGKSEFDAAMLKQGAPKEAWEIINSSSIDRPSNSRKPGQEQNRVLDAILLRAKMQESVKSLLLSRQRAPFKIAMEKCSEFLPGTREWLFTDIARWVSLEGEGGSGAFVLLAGAGVGKSVIMAEVARRGSKVLASLMGGEYTQSGIPPVAMHFFRSSDSVECSIFTACFSIAQQLKALVPSFELPPEEEVRSLSAGQVFRHMIVNPCIKVGLAQTSKVVVLLDALDECKESKELVSSMQASWPSRPSWLLLVTASRPEDAIAKATAGFKPTVLVPTSQNNRDDLHVYLEKNLILWGCSYRYLMDVTEAIFVLSEGVFIWIKFVERSIRDLGATAEGITPKTILLIPSGMSNVYSRYFGTLFKGLGAKMYSNAVAIALLTTRELIPEQVWREALGFGDSESEMDRFTELVLEPASKLLLFETTESGERVLKPPHKSMLDWLTVGASSMSLEALAVTATAHHHEMVARVLERHYRAQSGEAWEVFSGSDLVREFATAHVGYHFAQADNWTEASKPFVEFDYLFRTVCQARKDERYERMLDDCAGLLTSPIPPATAKRVKFILSVLTLARTSLMHDPRELAGQTLGRVMVAPFDEEDQQFWICAAQDWIARASAKGGLKVAVPLVFGRSGLEPADTKLLKILNHSSGVTSIAFSRDRQTVVVGCKNNTVRVWDVNTSKSLQVFEAHAKGVNSVCFSQDGKTVVSGSGDCTTRVWDVATGAELQCFTGDTASGDLSKDAGVYAVALSPDGSAVLMGSFDSTAIVWDVKTGKELRRFKGDHEGAVFTVAISSDGKLAATGSDDGTASVWDMATGKELQCFKGHTSAVYSVVFSSDAKTIVTGAADGDARVWDVSTGASVHTLKGHSDAIYSVAISQNAKTIITGSADATIKVWDADTGAEVECLEGHTGYLYGVSLSEDGQMLATCGDDMTARIWNLKVGKALKALKSLGSPTSMVLAPDGRTILTGSTDRIVRAWDVESGELVQSFAGHTGTVLSIKVSLDSKRIQTKDNKSNILVWDLKSGARLDDVTIVCSSTDSVDCSSDGCVVPACSDEEVADSSVVGFTLDMPNTDLEGLGSITYGEFGSSFLAWTIGDSKCRG